MTPTQPRRKFLQHLLALPLLGHAPSLAAGSPVDYELNVFPVAGFMFHEGPQLLDRLRPGDRLALVAEPGNRHDARAIRIEAFGRHIGYVPRSENGPLSRLLAQGATLHARVADLQSQGAPWQTVNVAVSLRVSRLG